jgi:hypothetical protein
MGIRTIATQLRLLLVLYIAAVKKKKKRVTSSSQTRSIESGQCVCERETKKAPFLRHFMQRPTLAGYDMGRTGSVGCSADRSFDRWVQS